MQIINLSVFLVKGWGKLSIVLSGLYFLKCVMEVHGSGGEGVNVEFCSANKNFRLASMYYTATVCDLYRLSLRSLMEMLTSHTLPLTASISVKKDME